MDESDSLSLRATFIVAILYVFAGVAPNVFARSAPWREVQLWRYAAFAFSAVAFAAHIAFEHFRLGRAPRQTAWHTAVAVALGAFGLALWANIHDLGSASGYRPRMAVALVAWPLLTAVPAFVVALVAAAGLKALSRSRS